MVREVEPVPPLELLELVLLLSLLSLPHAATPNDSAASRQAEPARFRTRNVSPPQGIDSGESASLNRDGDAAQWSPLHTTRWKCGLTTAWGPLSLGNPGRAVAWSTTRAGSAPAICGVHQDAGGGPQRWRLAGL